MREYVKRLPQEVQDLIRLAGSVSGKNNMTAYLVGGFVRDLILGVKNLDLDIVVEGDGIRFAEDLASALKAKLIRHRRFNTATIVLKHSLKIDIATARSETYPYSASLPEVTAGSLNEDLARRDFTINAMAISINSRDFGRSIDVFQGNSDLKNKKIRVLHDLSFIDDPTRILRALRFSTRYSFEIEPRTLRLLRDALRKRMLEKVQPQRLRDEIILILKESQPLKQIRQLRKVAGLSFISPCLKLSAHKWAFLRSIETQVNWFKKKFPQRRTLDAWLIYFMGLLDSLDINEVKSVCGRFVFRAGEEKRISSYKKISRKFISELSKNNIRPSRIFALLEPLSYEVIILIRARYKYKNIQRHIADFLEIYNGMRIYISGHDLKGLGLTPGPRYQRIFTQVLNAKLNGSIKSKEEELSLIRELIKIP
jgi:tRNA nucleotidyltransferase (CCA-adding enzyme)